MDCYRSGAPVTVVDLTDAAARWPRFGAAVTQRGIDGSVHALPLRLRGEPVGTLNMFHRTPGPLPAADLALGQALADVAAIGIVSERAICRGEGANEQLQKVLTSRVVIEQAKGVLTERGHLGMDEAFDRMRRYARDHNLRLSEVAREIVETDLAAEDVLAQPSVKTLNPGGSHM